MKRMMCILAFVGIGLFASASDGKIEKIKLPIKKEVKNGDEKSFNVISKESKIKMTSPTVAWQVTYNCGSYSVTVCCFSSWYSATLYMDSHDCSSYPPPPVGAL